MRYFFILGTNPTLSIAEILSIFSEAKNGQLLPGEIFVFEKGEIEAKNLIKTIGGTVKIGMVSAEAKKNAEQIKKAALKMFDLKNIKGGKKYNFGISNYSKTKINEKVLGMEIKKYFKENGISSRWVTSREKTLSSVVVEQNGLVDGGAEIVLLEGENKILIGKTIAVQPFKELSFRDYGRPARDDRSGMLPPKLAQIMINLALPAIETRLLTGQAGHDASLLDTVLLDPFCGSGTILTEAMLMGYKNLVGADISQKVVGDTKKNIGWTKEKFKISGLKFQVFNANSTQLSNFIKPNSIDTIVTEPYLGPQRGKVDFAKIKKELEALYSKTLAEFHKILKSGGRAVMVWPVFRATPAWPASRPVAQRLPGRQAGLSPALNNLKIINPIPEPLRNNKNICFTDRNTIIYGREGQKVWREIVVLEK